MPKISYVPSRSTNAYSGHRKMDTKMIYTAVQSLQCSFLYFTRNEAVTLGGDESVKAAKGKRASGYREIVLQPCHATLSLLRCPCLCLLRVCAVCVCNNCILVYGVASFRSILTGGFGWLRRRHRSLSCSNSNSATRRTHALTYAHTYDSCSCTHRRRRKLHFAH